MTGNLIRRASAFQCGLGTGIITAMNDGSAP